MNISLVYRRDIFQSNEFLVTNHNKISMTIEVIRVDWIRDLSPPTAPKVVLVTDSNFGKKNLRRVA